MTEQPICAHGFNSTICVAPAGHAGAHVTSNERFPHGLAIITSLELRGPALPAPPFNERYTPAMRDLALSCLTGLYAEHHGELEGEQKTAIERYIAYEGQIDPALPAPPYPQSGYAGREYDDLERYTRATPPGDWATAWSLFIDAMRLLRKSGAALPAEHAPPDPKRLSEIRARLNAATPGPWSTVAIPAAESELAIPHDENHTGPCICGERIEHVDLFREYVPMVPLANSHRPEEGINVFVADMSKPQQQNVACLVHVNEDDPNVALIKNAPEDIRYLLELVRGSRPALAGRPLAIDAISAAPRSAVCGAIVGIRGFDGQCTRLPAHRGAHFDSRYDVMDRGDGGRPEGPSAPATTAEIATALDDVLQSTAWEGRGASIAPALFAALKSRRGDPQEAKNE